MGGRNGAEVAIDIAVTETFVHTHGGFITADSFGAGQAGDIHITADILRMDDEALIASGAFAHGNAGNISIEATHVILTSGALIESVTIDRGQGGTITVRASDTVMVTGTTPDGIFPSAIRAETLGEGNAGSMLIEAQTVMLIDGGTIISTTLGPGHGGDVTVRASGSVILMGTSQDVPSSIRANSLGFEGVEIGDGGNILVEARRVEITGGARISSDTVSTGRGGNVTVQATDTVIVAGVDELGLPSAIASNTLNLGEGAGDGGAILVEARMVVVSGGAEISGGTSGPGRGGEVSVIARDAVILEGTSPDGLSSVIGAEALGAGDAGTVLVEGQTVTLTAGARISSATRGSGRGGTVTVTATDAVTIDGSGSGIFTDTTGDQSGGDITVTAQDIRLTHGAMISAQSSGEGDAGIITLTAEDTFLSEGSSVTTAAAQADGGNIRVTAGKLIRLQDSQVTATVGEGEGAGGNITMNSKLVALLNSQVRADAFGGPGGNITIVADALLADPTSSVTASSARNVDGDVEIRAVVADPSAAVKPLTQDFGQAAVLIPQRCAARRHGRLASSFIFASRDSIPAEPDSALPSPLAPVRQTALEAGLRAYQRGDFEQAVHSWEEAAKSYERDGQHFARSAALLYLGQAYRGLGRVTKAIQSLETALTLARAAGNRLQTAMVLGGLGNTYAMTGPVHKAQQHLQQAHDMALSLNSAGLAASIENDRGNLRISQAEPQKALAAYLKSIDLAQKADQPILAAYARTNAAVAALQAGQHEDAASRLGEALKHMQRLAPTHDTAYGLTKIGLAYDELRRHLSKRQDALLRQALAALNAAVAVAQTIDDARALAYAWGYLGYLYESEGRYEEARELTRRAVGAAQRVQAPESLYRWQWQTGRLLHAQGQLQEALEAYRQAVATAQSIRHELPHSYGKPPTSFRLTTGRLYFEFVDLLLQRAATLSDQPRATDYLHEARTIVEQFKAAELQDYFRDDCVDATRAQVTSLDAVSKTAIVVYPILLPNRIELLVSLPSGLQRFDMPVSAQRVTQEVRDLRVKLEKRTSWAFLPHAQQLYDWLIRPLESALRTIELETLVFVPDGPLRTIPMAVLHDGAQFLIRKYSMAITPSLDLTDPRPLQRSKAKVLAMGLTKEVQGFPSLPHVENELQTVKNLYDSGTMLNEAFRVPSIERELRNEPFTIVHIATHGQFRSDVEQTFLLTFDDKLTMDRLDQLIGSFQFRDDPLELLTLSACQTAAGDDRAALGLAGIAIKAGARSALASLWFINDESSTILVSEFYRQLQATKVSRAVALQRAQLKLLDHPLYEHPVYWSPFLLINNWL